MMENSEMIKSMGGESNYLLVEVCMRDNGKTMRCMDKESCTTQTGTVTKELFEKEIELESENRNLQTEISMTGSGGVTICTEKESLNS